jgi:hypothetical protein
MKHRNLGRPSTTPRPLCATRGVRERRGRAASVVRARRGHILREPPLEGRDHDLGDCDFELRFVDRAPGLSAVAIGTEAHEIVLR